MRPATRDGGGWSALLAGESCREVTAVRRPSAARILGANPKKRRENSSKQECAVTEAESPHNTPAYWQALGQFVHEFTEVEREINLLLWYLTDRDVAVAAAIYRERMPISAVISAVEKLYPIRMGEPQARRIFQQNLQHLKRIANLRNDLLHNGTTFTENGAEIVRLLAARRDRKQAGPSIALSVETLVSLRDDCGWLGTYLWLQWQFFANPEMRAGFNASNVEAPWHFK
jgi:hypothetical protein